MARLLDLKCSVGFCGLVLVGHVWEQVRASYWALCSVYGGFSRLSELRRVLPLVCGQPKFRRCQWAPVSCCSVWLSVLFCWCLSFCKATADAAAESLSKNRRNLSLSGLTTLSDATAESLSKHQGALFLVGLTTLSVTAAGCLSKYAGYMEIELGNLHDSAGEILRQHPSFQEDDDDDWDDDDE